MRPSKQPAPISFVDLAGDPLGIITGARSGTADCGEYRQAAGAIAESLIAAVQFFGSIAVSVHNALNRVITSRTAKDL